MVLAAVIVLPMVLDSERESLPDNVAIQIPGQNTPFQPNLTAGAPAQPGTNGVGTPAPVTPAAPAGNMPAAETNPRLPASIATITPLPSTGAAVPPTEPVPAKPAPAKPVAVPKPTAPTAPPAPRTPPPNAAAVQKEAEAARALALLQGKPAPAARSASSASAAPSRYAVQVVAVRSREGADSLLSTLRGAGLAAYIETIKTPDGQVHRVRLGPFNSKSQAESAQAKLRGLPGGYNGSLVPL